MPIPGPKLRLKWRGNDRGRMRAFIRVANMLLRRNQLYINRGGKTMLALADQGNLQTLVADIQTALTQKEQIGS